MGGRSSKTTRLSEIPETAASAIATNATTEMMDEMRQEQKETAAQMKHLTDMLLEATTSKTPLPTTPLPTTDGVFYNPSTTRRVCHLPPKNVQTSGLLRGKHIRTCSSCNNNWVTHAYSECYELEANLVKRRSGWKNYLL